MSTLIGKQVAICKNNGEVCQSGIVQAFNTEVYGSRSCHYYLPVIVLLDGDRLEAIEIKPEYILNVVTE